MSEPPVASNAPLLVGPLLVGPLLVGLSGGLASGKSTVARRLAAMPRFEVFDADRLVADSYRPEAEGSRAVEELFGREMLRPDGSVDTQRLASLVFEDGSARHRLEARLHPLVRATFASKAAASVAEVVILEATLLVEAGYGPDFDWVISVEADEAGRLERAVGRGMERSAAQARLLAQGDGAARRRAAHRILRNTGSLADLDRAVDALAQELLLRARAHRAGRLPFALVTANPGKRVEAERLAGVPLEVVDLDLPEIQSLDLEAVLRAKGEEAWRRLRRPLVVEETGLFVDALGGFPGPLVKWMLEACGPEGIARAARALGPAGAEARASLLWISGDSGEKRVLVTGSTRGELVLPARGTRGFGWDPVFEAAEGEGRTYGELEDAEKDSLSHRGRAWRALLQEVFVPEFDGAESSSSR